MNVRRVTLLVAIVLVVACGEPPTQSDVTPMFNHKGVSTVVTTLAEWQNAIASAEPGSTIEIEGTIDVPGGEEVFLTVPDVTIKGASAGSGLRGVPNGDGAIPLCLVCVGPTADGATAKDLTLGGGVSDAALYAASDRGATENVTFTNNHVDCDPCAVFVFFHDAPHATFTDNVLMGQPSFSAIQIQAFSAGVLVKDNWVEHGGPVCGIRLVAESDGAEVADNTIASAPTNAICAVQGSDGGTFRDNTILEITGVDPFTGDPFDPAPSCLDTSTGSGTAGTGNSWQHNVAPGPSEPLEICGPAS